MRVTLLVLLFITTHLKSTSPQYYIEVANKNILSDQNHSVIMSNNSLSNFYNDTIFRSQLICRNDYLQIVNYQEGKNMVFYYANIPQFAQRIKIQNFPHEEPRTFIQSIAQNQFIVNFNCTGQYSSQNYFNQIVFKLDESYLFSLLINCDPQGRHKQFQIGYIFISFINTAIIVGVAMHSHVWSIKIKLRPLRFELQWIPFLIFSIIGSILIIILTKFYIRESIFFEIIKFSGIIISAGFVFLCFNQIFYLFRNLRKQIFKFIRLCDTISIILTIIMIVLAFLFENWVFYDFVAGCICVGSIKIFHFNSLKKAFSSMIILVTNTTILAIILHFILPLSYNDYAGELSSPFFLQVPDLVNNLFKKCSWLPIIDVIIPGVTLSYLRVYDQNRSSQWGGLYTLTGNLVFVIATALWILIEYIYPFSVPFCLVTYPILMLSIFFISWRRRDWMTLLQGRFEQGNDTIDESTMVQKRQSFGQHIPKDQLQDLLIKQQTRMLNNSTILTD